MRSLREEPLRVPAPCEKATQLCTGSPSQYTLSSVLRSAGLLSLNLRERGSGLVPANGCLATLLLRWQSVRSRTVQNHIPQTAWENLLRQVRGNLRLPLTVTYHGCPASPPASPLLAIRKRPRLMLQGPEHHWHHKVLQRNRRSRCGTDLSLGAPEIFRHSLQERL
jgi:hypothetical protein